MTNLILCGGVGTRLWPLSRNLMPKQFYPLIDNKSLFELTVLRNRSFVTDYIIAVNKAQYFLANDQLLGLEIKEPYGLLEPVGRNTAPAIALSLMNLDRDEIVLVTPSDHLIKNENEYHAAVIRAKELAENGYIVTFGIQPQSPETGFGYIESNVEDVISFKEKPTEDVAKSFLEAGNYLWNSGMFCFKAGVFLDELKIHSKDVYDKCYLCFKDISGDKILKPELDLMNQIPSISIDYAIMEKSDKIKVVKCDLNWSDLGSFDALYFQNTNKDKKNALLGVENEILLNSKNNLIVAGKRRIACVDVDDLIIVDTEDALLVAKRGSSQKVKEVVEELKKDAPYLLEAPQTVKRPWGSYTVLQNPTTFKVKRIEVKPGKRLSLQYHKMREEHWTFVAGTAKVRIGEITKVFTRNEHAFIPLEALHRVENIGDDMVVFIETQVGTYFGEDDIIRVEDDWGRT